MSGSCARSAQKCGRKVHFRAAVYFHKEGFLIVKGKLNFRLKKIKVFCKSTIHLNDVPENVYRIISKN